MPGGRLTHDDRRSIAAGLADGLGYAGIARRLDRPTSTVSREVNRNGGPGGYRADHAHRASEWRARRRTTPPPAPEPERPGALRDFEERFTELLVVTGLPRMPARVLTCLYTTDSGSMASAGLVRRLRVSPASVSKAVAYLEGQELVRRERDGRRGPERYVIDDDVWLRAILMSARTNAALAEAAFQGVGVFGAGTPAGARLEGAGRVLRHVSDDLVEKAGHWRRALARGGPDVSPPTPSTRPDAP
ncbi:helix-turn-helix domain-containing protein [Streptomyces sp. AV19]|uniref:MarR family transcriptional regulator n=1 Tax=Streptomyces sp. AV19 TaxID=2793068 RepID=UPI0018FEEC42|nr:helix-turn-helix domain-containing protein [Streptomyces sp. AV19]MBH1935942.1 helix-turn-helix domain-containing protein [Streptomyces sp. AV19]MDG4534269.1 helix-turn-helix domain-containing protein [Streptomyces sp. AV19]